MALGYKYQEIQGLPAMWEELVSPELESLASIWQERRAELEDSQVLLTFNDRLAREWSIETGIIEKLYDIDRGITHTLIERGIEASLIPHGTTDRPATEIVRILKDHQTTLEGMFAFIKQNRELTSSYIKELHQTLTRSQETVDCVDSLGNLVEVPMLRGAWKKLPNNPTRPDGHIHEYCPPIRVQDEMDRLILLHRQHETDSVPPEVEAVWLHHRFTQIHPFQDGNGRVARALTALIFIRSAWFPPVVHRDQRTEYISALEAADSGDLKPLTALFLRIQKKAFTRALALSESVLSGKVQIVLDSIAEAFRRRAQAHALVRLRHVQDTSKQLQERAQQRLSEVAEDLHRILSDQDSHYSARAETSTDDTMIWYQTQIIEVAKSLDYFADVRSHRAWVRLKIREERQVYIVISFHCLGVKFVGIGAVSAFIEYRERDEEGGTSIHGLHPLCTEVFQYSYKESKQSIVKRFTDWLEVVIATGLSQWKGTLGEGA